MTRYGFIGLMMLAMLAMLGCQGGAGNSRSSQSQFADEQPRENYIHSAAYINVQLGVGYMNEGNYGIALSKLKKALTQNPNLAIGHSTIAVLYERLGENSLAESHYKRSIQLDKNDARLRNNYGQFLCKHHNELQGIKQFDIAAANPLYPTPHMPLTNAGLCAMRVNEDVMAENYFRRALEKNPNMVPALLGMMQLSVEQAKYLQGKAYLQRYTGLAKHNADTLWNAYRIEKHLGDKQAAANYAVRLKSRFPDSAQTQLLLKEMSRR